MKIRIFIIALIISAVCYTTVAVSDALAQQYISYAAKFTCGPIKDNMDVVKGDYATAINIHNPQFATIVFYKKAVIANPERSPRGPISQIRREYLNWDEAMYVDCTDIRGLFAITLPEHIEGFVHILIPVLATTQSPEFDVWAKYTARHRTGPGGVGDVTTDVESMDIEDVRGKWIGTPAAVAPAIP